MNPKPDNQQPPILEVSCLKTHFQLRGDRPMKAAVDDVHFEVYPNEVFAITGHSGSGKSTIARSLLGLVRGAPGVVDLALKFNGRPIVEARGENQPLPAWQRGYRRRIHRALADGTLDSFIIFQEPVSALNPHLQIWRQVAECPWIREGRKQPLKAYRGEAEALLERVGFPDINDHIDDYPHQLSAGMCQRAVLAMALGSRASFIIADEPTAKLDPQTQADIVKLLAEESFSMLLITHDFDVIEQLANRVAILEQGRIVEHGTTTDIINTPQELATQELVGAYLDLK
jgi:ABC-type glutathione transport system ATPase component